MRSQASKPVPKKGALSKTSKVGSTAKQTKKKVVSPKKVRSLVNKSLVKSPKKNSTNDESNKKSEGDNTDDNKSDGPQETSKGGPSKGNSRSNSPTKKTKKDLKEKKDSPKAETSGKKVVKKPGKPKNTKEAKFKNKNEDIDNDDIKYKINVNANKKPAAKFSKAKTVIKKSNNSTHTKKSTVKKQEIKERNASTDTNFSNEDSLEDVRLKKQTENVSAQQIQEESLENKCEINTETKTCEIPTTPTKSQSSAQPDTPKSETERPPKFFTSTRSPRMVDIDVKCLKTSKGNLSVSERFVSMKCDTKSEECTKDKNTLVSQGPEIDVYTFTEKVDSPKNILSDFRSPTAKNVGRVRPIARVKGTVIDRKTDEKKKYSPHRPIEEVVKQLKANKRSEELNSPIPDTVSGIDSSVSITSSEKEVEEKPKPIVSKSYKMVARKSSITGKPFSPIKFLDQEPTANKNDKSSIATNVTKKTNTKTKKQQKKSTTSSDDEFDSCKFSINTNSFHYTSSDESVSESNDDNDTKGSSDSDTNKKKAKNKKYKRITDSSKKGSKELRELSKDSLVDLKSDSSVIGSEKPSKRRLKLLSMWTGPKKHRMASLNAIAKVHCLYENESRTHMELGLMKTVDRQPIPGTSKQPSLKKKEVKCKDDSDKQESTSESEYENKKEKKDESSESSDDNPPQRSLRGVPGIRSAGKYWDPKSSTSSSEDSELESKKKTPEKKKASSKQSSSKSDTEKPPAKMKKTAGVPVKKKRNRNEVVMDLKDMVVQKRMASLNATAILAASYEKRSPKSTKDDTTSDSCSDESFSQKSKNGVGSGVKSEVKQEENKKECEEVADRKQKVEVIVNQDTDVTITGVYSTHHHEGFCTVSGMQYRISSTSHTQTTATANCEKDGCPRDDSARYTPLSALSSMQPPAEHAHPHPHPVAEIGGLSRRPGCSSAFSAPAQGGHHEPGKPYNVCDTDRLPSPRSYGYYQPAGPLIKETGVDAERALARYHPPPHYHPPHPPVLPQYGPSYYPPDLCYGRYYRPQGPYHMPPQPDAQMVGVGGEPFPPSQYYGAPPCYQHSPQRIPYVEYRGCPCPLNACPKNGLIGPATGKAPTGGGPADAPSALAHPGGAFRAKVRACALDAVADTHGSGKDPPLELEPPAAADAPHPCPLPTIGGASPKREMFDVRDGRLVGDTVRPADTLDPPSPARGSAGACAPQPPPPPRAPPRAPPPRAPQRRARLGKAMARRTLAGEDTGLLLYAPPPAAHHSDADDDVLAISPPLSAPIDLSSSDERSTPLVDVKKENEGPTQASPRKTDAQALKEHNSATALSETTENTDSTKAVKRRYSKPKLEIDMIDVQLEDGCKTNGIGEHVKLQKRRKVSGEQTNSVRPEPTTKEPKKKTTNARKTPKTPNTEKKTLKRKSDNCPGTPKAKKMLLGPPAVEENVHLKNTVAMPENVIAMKPKNKSALVLDNLLRKNSIDRLDAKHDKELNPAELFLTANEKSLSSQIVAKKTLNINNNVVENNNSTVTGVRRNTIAAVTQHIEKKKSCKLEKVDSKITHSIKSVLKAPIEKIKLNEISMLSTSKCKMMTDKFNSKMSFDVKPSLISRDECDNPTAGGKALEEKLVKPLKGKSCKNEADIKASDESHSITNKILEHLEIGQTEMCKILSENKAPIASTPDKVKRSKLSKGNGQLKHKSIESVAKLLVSKRPLAVTEGPKLHVEEKTESSESIPTETAVEFGTPQFEKATPKRGKPSEEKTSDRGSKRKSIEKVAKLLVSKKSMPKTDELNHAQTNQIDTRQSAKSENPPEKPTAKRKLSSEMKGKGVEKVVKLLVSKKPAIKVDEATSVIEDACASPVPCARRGRRRRSGPRGAMRRGPRRALALPAPPDPGLAAPPRWNNGWKWDSDNYISKVYLNNRTERTARCYSRMSHKGGDTVSRGDSVLLRASTTRSQPFVAKVASLWENPEDGEMMVSLVWYYRPEHTELGRAAEDAPDEVFASRHRDANYVACIEDKCYVLTFNEYCRYRKRLKALEEGVSVRPSIVPPPAAADVGSPFAPNDTKIPPTVSSELVLFCRKTYDYRSKKIQVPNK